MNDSTIALALKFSGLMLQELRANEHKGDWEQWNPDDATLIKEIRHHVDKLDQAIFLRDAAAVADHCADLGNLAMKALEIFGQK